MLYKALYLPVDKPLEDGCDVINKSGEVFTYDAEQSGVGDGKYILRAELFLVSFEFNQLVIIGMPSPEAGWLKNGMDVKAVDCEAFIYNKGKKEWSERCDDPEIFMLGNLNDFLRVYFRIKCPTCHNLH